MEGGGKEEKGGVWRRKEKKGGDERMRTEKARHKTFKCMPSVAQFA